MEEYDTLGYYNANAEAYFEATKNGDMSKVYERFLMLLPDGAYILDFGCGSGRDSKYFLEHGYKVKAIDGSENLCELASKFIGQDVEHMTFDQLKAKNEFDGIWACSSLLHLREDELPDVFGKMNRALKDGGAMYMSFKKGEGCDVQQGKLYTYMTKERLEEILKEAAPQSEVVDYSENVTCPGVNRPSTTWINVYARKREK